MLSVKYIAFLSLVLLTFSCQKEVIQPNVDRIQTIDSIEPQPLEASTTSQNGGATNGGGDDGGSDITDPNNDEDNNKRKKN